MRFLDKYRKFLTKRWYTPHSHHFTSYELLPNGSYCSASHQRRILGVCLHYTAGRPPHDFDIMTGQTSRQVSSTFYVAPEVGAIVDYYGERVVLEPGEVIVTLDPLDFPWTQGVVINGPRDKKHLITAIESQDIRVNPNVYDISFEISNIGWLHDPNNPDGNLRFQPYGPRQIDSVVTALADVMMDLDIPWNDIQIHGHEGIDNWKTDPGPQFPWQDLEARVKAVIQAEEVRLSISEPQAQALAQEIWARNGLDLNLDHAVPRYWYEQLMAGNNLGSPLGYEVDDADSIDRRVIAKGNLYMPVSTTDSRELLVAFFQQGILWVEKGVWQVHEGMPPVEAA